MTSNGLKFSKFIFIEKFVDTCVYAFGSKMSIDAM